MRPEIAFIKALIKYAGGGAKGIRALDLAKFDRKQVADMLKDLLKDRRVLKKARAVSHRNAAATEIVPNFQRAGALDNQTDPEVFAILRALLASPGAKGSGSQISQGLRSSKNLTREVLSFAPPNHYRNLAYMMGHRRGGPPTMGP